VTSVIDSRPPVMRARGRVAQRLAVDVQPAHAEPSAWRMPSSAMAHRLAGGQHHGDRDLLRRHALAVEASIGSQSATCCAHLLERGTQQPLAGRVHALQRASASKIITPSLSDSIIVR
jgi:hypothetical protein